ncbi:COPII subunit, partial [Rhizopus stolonifer]
MENPIMQPMPQSNKQYHQQTLTSPTSTPINKRFDVALLGSKPMLEDSNAPMVPHVPLNISVTPSSQAQCPSDLQRCTLTTVPYSSHLLRKSKLPLSLLIEPYPRTPPTQIPLIDHGLINRCMRCKSFINPFAQFIEGGLKWQCNICGLDDNDVPPAYDWNHITQQKADRWNRPELNYGCVDYVASPEFMSRPPQPPVYVFVIDTSAIAVQTGMIEVLAEALLAAIDDIPNKDGRTRIGFMTTGHAIGFYSLANKEPELLMMPDIEDIYLPRVHSDLVVNLMESKPNVLNLLKRLKGVFTNNVYTDNKNCLGPALLAARELLSSTGGKIVCFQAVSPNYGVGALLPSKIHKQNSKTTGNNVLLEPASEFYKTFSEECVKSHVCADMFVFGSQDIDVATLNVLPRYTGGQMHYYPGFNAKNQGDKEKLKLEIEKLIKEEVGLEAIVRTRCSSGIVCKAYHGNFSFQEPDILVLPNIPRDLSYCIDLAIEKEIQTEFVSIQTCMLFTTSAGERIIRVMTTCLPVTKKVTEVFYGIDQMSLVRAINYQAIDTATKYKIKDAKEQLIRHIVDICKSYSKEVIGIVPSKSTQLNLCRSLSLLPAMVLAIIKSEAFSDTGVVPVNMSSQSAILLKTLPSSLWSRYVYPSIYSLHNMPVQAGTLDSNNKCILPPRLNLSSERMERHGCYLVENGQRILIWMGREAVPQLCMDLLNAPNITHVTSGQ